MTVEKMNRKIAAVIPARFASVRFPGKPLADLFGKPMLQWVIEGVSKSKLIDDLIVATDNERIFQWATDLQKRMANLNLRVVMTSAELNSGTDRVFAAIKDTDEYQLVVNIQGDEPLIEGERVDELVRLMIENPEVDMATLAHPMELNEFESKNAVKVILNENFEAIYFSRFPIPFSRRDVTQALVEKDNKQFVSGVFKHIGMYGFKPGFLNKFCSHKLVDIEAGESLEQLRALYMGAKIKVLIVDQGTQGVDTPEDLRRVQKIIEDRR